MSAIRKFSHEYVKFSPRSVARCLKPCQLNDVLEFLTLLDKAERILLFPHLNSYVISAFLLKEESNCTEILNQLSDVHAAAVLTSISEPERAPLLTGLDERRRLKIERLMSFIPNTAGSLIDSSVMPVRSTQSIKSCAAAIAAGGRYYYYIYIVGDDDALIGVTTMRRIFEMKSSNDSLDSIMDTHLLSIRVDDSISEILGNPGWDQHHSMPVIDYQGRLLGVISYSTLKTLQKKRDRDQEDEDVYLTGADLGELYSLGFSAFLGSAGSVAKGMGGKK